MHEENLRLETDAITELREDLNYKATACLKRCINAFVGHRPEDPQAGGPNIIGIPDFGSDSGGRR